MRGSLGPVLVLSAVAISACSSPPPPAPPPAPAPAPPPKVEAPPEPDLSPVAAPKNLLAVGRWKNVHSTLRAIQVIGALPIPLEALIEKEVGDKEEFATLKLDAPVEMAVLFDMNAPDDKPDASVAFSLPLQSLEKAMAVVNRGAGKALQIKPGVFRVGRLHQDLMCDVSVSLGEAPARLVCAPKERDLDVLVPWMTRGQPTMDMGKADLHLELRFSAPQERYRKVIEQWAPSLPNMVQMGLSRELKIDDPALMGVVRDVVDEGPKLAMDLDTASIDVSLDQNGAQASVSGSMKFKSAESWLVKALTHRSDKAGPPPAIFWQAPKGSTSVVFNRGADRKLVEPVRKGLGTVVGAVLKRAGVPDAERSAIDALWAKMPLDEGNTVTASGVGDAKWVKIEKNAKPADVVKAVQARVAGFGWSIVGVEGKPEAWEAWVKDLQKTYNAAGMQKFLKASLKHVDKKADRLMPQLRSVGAPKGLPKGTQALEVTVNIESTDVWSFFRKELDYASHPKGAAAKGKVSVYLVVMPDGDKTWVGFGGDLTALGKELAAVKTGAPADGTIAKMAGLEALRDGKLVSGGFLTMGRVISTVRDSVGPSLSESERADMEGALGSLPNKGATPVLLLGTGHGGSKPDGTLEWRIQKGTIEDIQGLSRYIQANAGRHHGGSMKPPHTAPIPPPPPPVAKPRKK